MKILHVVPFFAPVFGGSVEVAYHLCRELAGKGHDVTLYTSDYRLDRPYAASLKGVRVCSFKTSWNWSNLYVTPDMVGAARREVSGFDVVHLHHFRTFQNVAVARHAERCGVPCVLQAHGTVLRIVERQRLKRLFDLAFGYRLLRSSRKVIAVAGIEVEQYKAMGVDSERIEMVPNAIDPSEYVDLPARGGFRRNHGIGEEEKVILFLGRIHKSKGIDLLARAYSGLSSTLPKSRVVIVGPDDGYVARLRQLVSELGIQDRVMILGSLYGKDKLAAYVDADVYVLPSTDEIFGLTVLEALMCGTPVIATDRCGVSPWLDNRGGVVVPFDPEALRGALESMLADPDARQRFGCRGGGW